RQWMALALSVGLAASTGAAPAPPPADPTPTTSPNLVEDPQFDSGASGFYGQDTSSVVVRTTQNPLEGEHSLHVEIHGYGNHVWWDHDFTGGLASALRVGAHLRSDVDSASELSFRAMAYYADGNADSSCTDVNGSAGDKGTVLAA